MNLNLSRATLDALFYLDGSGGTFFPGPVDHYVHGRVHVAEVIHADGAASQIKMVEWDGMSPEPSSDFSLDLSIPWVHERVAATCLRLLGVPNPRAACMTRSTMTVYTLRWADGADGLPRTASWDRLGGYPIVATYQNDLVIGCGLKRRDIPRLDLKPDATHDDALAALLRALDARGVVKAPTPPATP